MSENKSIFQEIAAETGKIMADVTKDIHKMGNAPKPKGGKK